MPQRLVAISILWLRPCMCLAQPQALEDGTALVQRALVLGEQSQEPVAAPSGPDTPPTAPAGGAFALPNELLTAPPGGAIALPKELLAAPAGGPVVLPKELLAAPAGGPVALPQEPLPTGGPVAPPQDPAMPGEPVYMPQDLPQELLAAHLPQEPATSASGKTTFPPGSEAEVAVPTRGEGVHFLRCSITGPAATNDTYDIYLMDVAPAYRRVEAVPGELLRPKGGAGLPLDQLDALLEGRGPQEHSSDIMSAAVERLRQSAGAPINPGRGAELEAQLLHETAKAKALQERLLQEEQQRQEGQALGQEPRRRSRSRRDRGSSRRNKGTLASNTFESLDRNGDGVVSMQEYAEHTVRTPPSPRPRGSEAIKAAKKWEQRARDADSKCYREDRAQLLRALDAMRREEPEAMLARLHENCAGSRVRKWAMDYEELTACLQDLSNVSWQCSLCPVKFAISASATCTGRCASLPRNCSGHEACRAGANDCLDCMRQPTLRFMRCLGVPGMVSLEKRFTRGPLPAAIFDERLANVTVGQEALQRTQAQAWAVQRLIQAWGLDPEGLDSLVAPLLWAAGAADTDPKPPHRDQKAADSTSALPKASQPDSPAPASEPAAGPRPSAVTLQRSTASAAPKEPQSKPSGADVS